MTDTLEQIKALAFQTDPIVMYLIVRESLGMGMGKTAAQCAHASQMLLLKYIEQEREKDVNFGFIGKTSLQTGCYVVDECAMGQQHRFKSWLDGSFRKVVLKADNKEWVKLKEIPNHILVVDSGLTEIAPGSETVIGFWPMYKSEVPKLIKKLQVLK